MSPDGPNTVKAAPAKSGPESQRTHSHDSAGLSGMQARRLGVLGLAIVVVVLWVAAGVLWSGVFR
jgi:hypothetical protein